MVGIYDPNKPHGERLKVVSMSDYTQHGGDDNEDYALNIVSVIVGPNGTLIARTEDGDILMGLLDGDQCHWQNITPNYSEVYEVE